MQASLPSVKYRTGWKDCYNSNYYRLVNESRDIFKNVDSLDKTQLRHIGFWLEEGLAWALNLLLWITPRQLRYWPTGQPQPGSSAH